MALAAVLLVWFRFESPLDWRLWSSAAAVTLIASVGWANDHRSMGIGSRLAAHTIGGALLLPLALVPSPVPDWLGLFAAAWWILGAVSAINIVNFMDGIDGLIGLQAMVYGAHLALAGGSDAVGVLGAALVGAATGFLAWNWAPARIFLGDVGSGSLGLLFVVGGLLLMRERGIGVVAAFLPLFPAFLDSTVTLTRRVWRRESITQAHRSHLYQRLANGGWGHARVSILYAGVAAAGSLVALTRPSSSVGTAERVYVLVVMAAAALLDRRA